MSEHNKFSHLKNNQPRMVDVSDKIASKRRAIAEARVCMPREITDQLVVGELHAKKGPVFATAIIAGTMAAKFTSTLIPFCHPLALEKIDFDVAVCAPGEIVIRCEVLVHSKTGVEMEALTGASIAALTIYDMCKALSHDITITATRLIEKTGGKSDYVSQK